MRAPNGDRRERLRAILADLKMPCALEAVDGILAEADSGAVSARWRLRSCSHRTSCYATTAAWKPLCGRHGYPRTRPWPTSTSPSSRASSVTRSIACTNSGSLDGA